MNPNLPRRRLSTAISASAPTPRCPRSVRLMTSAARDVLLQFLVEAMVMSLIGGAIGVAIGLVTAESLTAILDWPTEVSLTTVASAFGIAALVGITFGYYPARRASRLDPIDALRYE